MKVTVSFCLVLTAGAILGCGGGASPAEVTERADAFLHALEIGSWQVAYSDLSSSLQQQCGGSSNALGTKVIAAYESRVTSWEFTEVDVPGNSATIVALVQRDKGDPMTTGLALSRGEDRWVIDAIDVAGRELCPAN